MSEMNTYILCGLFFDYKMHSNERITEIQKEIKNMWDNNIHRETILQYVKDHEVSLDVLLGETKPKETTESKKPIDYFFK